MAIAGSGLGLLRDPTRFVLRRASEPAVLSPQMRRELAKAAPLIVAKSNLKSVVHRRVYMDYVGVRRYGPDGKPSGEVRFVGLFTAQAYDEPVRNVPLVRRKIDRVMARAGQAVGSHNAMRLANILETYPRDELFQASEDELLEIALGVLHLSDRPRVKLFVRADPFDRFISILFYAPRERYDARLREEVGQLLAEAFGGHVSAYYPNYSDAPLARVHYIVGVTPLHHRDPDIASLERAIALLARTWSDDFETVVRRRAPADQAAAILAVWAEAFPPGYRDRYGAAEGLADLAAASRLESDTAIAVRAFRHASDSPRSFRFKLYNEGEALALADVLPILDNMGLKALSEEGFVLSPATASGERRRVWVHEFALDDPRGEKLSFEAVRAGVRGRLPRHLVGPGRERRLQPAGAGALAAVARRGPDPGPGALSPAVRARSQPGGAAAGAERPSRGGRPDPRAVSAAARSATGGQRRRSAMPRSRRPSARIEEALQAVDSLDADRALRRLAALTAAIQRTNYYQPGPDGSPKPYISFKVASRELADLPEPKPYREIFVASPAVEGVHLRLGPIARGGLRWSDRRDDFRTEVLGLVKAQQVKNAVIVPVGSKGGFFPKRLPKGGAAADVRAEAIAAYRTFLDGLLDLTDNIDAEGKVDTPGGRRGARRRGPLPGRGGRQGHGDLLRHRQRRRRILRLLAGRRVRLRRLGRLRPQGHGHHRPRRLGGRQAPLPRARQGHPERAVQLRRRRRHVGRRVRQRHAAVEADPAGRRLRPPPRLPRSRPERRDKLGRAQAPVRAARARRGTTTTAR